MKTDQDNKEKSYLDYLNELAQEYSITGTTEEKVAYLQSIGIDPYTVFQIEEAKKEDELILTPIGFSKKITVDGELVNSYDWLRETFGFTPYVYGDSNTILNSYRTENEIKLFQQKLQDAGYLKQGSYILGTIDSNTIDSFNSLLGDSNTSGNKWNTLLEKILTSTTYDITELPTEAELDYNEITNTVINTVKKEIGREPTQQEIEILNSLLAGYKTEEFEQQKQLFMQQVGPKYTTGKTFTMTPSGPQITEGLRKVDQPEIVVSDPTQKFEAKVRELFKPEMDLNQRREQTRNVANIIKSSIAGLGSIGG